jgi:O-acetyl-ADP-ribose deacetylase (regulator of RNase III)
MGLRERIHVCEGDITGMRVDAIVNAANTTLLGGGGVDGAIHAAAGPELLEACRRIGGCPTGEVRLTQGYRLPAAWVIHAVGPIWSGGEQGEDDLLASCYRRAFAVAREHRIRSIAFPAISTGVYRFPLERATRIAVREAVQAVQEDDDLERVVFACFGRETTEAYQRCLADALGGAGHAAPGSSSVRD